MTILLIGGTGFLSGALVGQLRAAGHEVTLLTRGKTPLQDDHRAAVRVLTADRTNPRALKSAVSGKVFDAVFDMVAYRPEESRVVATLFRGRTGRFIHCSTVSVYMVSDRVTCPMGEDQDRAPLMPYFARNPFGMDYGMLKRECEQVLWQAHDERLFPVSMLRPTFISGPADPARRDWFWIQRILDGGPLLVPGSGEHPFQQVFLDDVARMFCRLLDMPATVGRAYNCAAEEVFSLNDYLRVLCELLGRAPSVNHVPQDRFDGLPISTNPLGDVFPFNTRRPAVFNLEAIKRDLGFRSTPFADWMTDTARWWSMQRDLDSFGYEHRGEELRLIKEGYGNTPLPT